MHTLKPITIFLTLIALGIALGIVMTQAAYAQSGGAYDLTWNSIDGGGAMFSSGGVYSLGGTVGQFDAGTLSGGAYTLAGGFWVDVMGNKVNLPLIMR